MTYLEYTVNGKMSTEDMIGILSIWPFEGFQEEAHVVLAYIPAELLSQEMESALHHELSARGLHFSRVELPEQNWNAIWESSFKPVTVGDFCYIRADFHPVDTHARYQLLINPKMAFGTAHHETTYMMIETMQDLKLEGCRVLDFGTGTGILAILAAKMGATSIIALDNDPLSVENAIENISLNEVNNVLVREGDLDHLPEPARFDIILANINLPVLEKSAEIFPSILKKGGTLLVSGILKVNQDRLTGLYRQKGLYLGSQKWKGEWSCMTFVLTSH